MISRMVTSFLQLTHQTSTLHCEDILMIKSLPKALLKGLQVIANHLQPIWAWNRSPCRIAVTVLKSKHSNSRRNKVRISVCVFQSSRNLLRCCSGQLSNSLTIFVGRKRKMPDKKTQCLLCLNTGLFIFSIHCKFGGKYAGKMYNLHSLKTE